MASARSVPDVDPPGAAPPFGDELTRIVCVAGVLGRGRRPHPDLEFTVDGVRVAVELLREQGVLLGPLPSGTGWAHWAAGAAEVIEHTPMPAAEWGPVVEVLGLDDTAAMLGTAPSSVRRYESGDRTTPQAVAERLHLLELVIADLSGSYNDYGIRRWFRRARTQLGGRSPVELLRGEWGPDDEGPSRVRELAGALIGLGAT